MASNYRLRRFSNPSTLKSLSAVLLRSFFAPFHEHLLRRELDLSGDQPIDYDKLAAILMSPDESMPDEMLDALFFVDEMAIPGCFDDLMSTAQTLGIDLPESPEPVVADLAVMIWLRSPQALERLHAERFLVKPKSFQSFLSTAKTLPPLREPADAVIEKLQNDLNDWFETKKRGRGTRVFVFIRDERAWFLVRHGQPYKREGTLEGDESSSIYYRPEKFDVMIYNAEVGELAVHASTQGEKRIYCKLIGRHLFGTHEFFDVDSKGGKYTLDPILEDARACLSCIECEVVEEISLCELHFRHDSQQYHVEVHKADDVFAALEDIDREIPPGAELLKAGFKVSFKDAIRERKLVLRPPAVAIFDRESDAQLLEHWMELRGFVQVNHAQRPVAVS